MGICERAIVASAGASQPELESTSTIACSSRVALSSTKAW